MPEGVLLNSALLMYILPLIMLIAGAMLGGLWAPTASSVDSYSALGALAGLVAGFALVKGITLRKQLSAMARPVILHSEEL
jgi:positive regulator of sigma E activity